MGKVLAEEIKNLPLPQPFSLKGLERFVFASLSTDGVDGPTEAAGAIIDSDTLNQAALLGLNPEQFLLENDSYGFFSRLGDLVFTGRTGTNVNDIAIMVIL